MKIDDIPGVSKMTDILEKSIKTKQSSIEIHRLLQYTWDSIFSGRNTFKFS